MAMTCTTMPPMTFRRMEWSSKKLQHPDNTYRYRQRTPTEGKHQDGTSPPSAKPPFLLGGATTPLLVSKTAVLQPRCKPQRRESCKRAESPAVVEDFSYPDPLVCAEGSSEFHKRIAAIQNCVQDTCKWELYHKRILSQQASGPSLLPTSRGYRSHSIHRAMSHVDSSISSTDLAEGTYARTQHRRPVLRKGTSLPDISLAGDKSSTPDRTPPSLPTGRSVSTGSSAAEQVHVNTCTTTPVRKSSSASSESDVMAAEKKIVKKRGKPVPVASDKMVQLPTNTMTSTVEESVQPRPPALPVAKQTRKKRSSARPTSAKVVHKGKSAKKHPRIQSAK